MNTAHLNHSGAAVATGDDFGCVKLFNHFPITEKFVSHFKHCPWVITSEEVPLLTTGI